MLLIALLEVAYSVVHQRFLMDSLRRVAKVFRYKTAMQILSVHKQMLLCPIGFNLNGGISNAALENCTVSGNPSIGIALLPAASTGITNTGILVDKCAVQGAFTSDL